MIGGGYATGRELAEFFFPAGPLGGLLGMLVSTVVFSLVVAASLEFARMTSSTDYRTFFQHLLGKGWIVFEVAYVAILLLVLSVLGAASGTLLQESMGLHPIVGTIGLMAVIALLVFYGSATIERFLAAWSVVLYATFIVVLVWCFVLFGEQITGTLSNSPVKHGWFSGGARYAGYNAASIPAILFCVHHLTTRREAVVAGLLAGPIGMLPAMFIFLAMTAFYPEIADEAIPSNRILAELNAPILHAVFQVVIFGTFIETGTALIHAVNERLANLQQSRGKEMPRWLRPTVAFGFLVVAVFIASSIGLIQLIGKGYGMITYVFIAIYVIPILTLGIYKIARTSPAEPVESRSSAER
jgi:uncharacterized membrane protein YkvI